MTTTTFDAHPRSSLIVALDFDSLSSAFKFASLISDLVGMFKIGNQLFTAAGPAAVREVAALGTGIFLDLKFHDIPNTVAGAVLSTAAMTGVQLVNVHALGGKAMLEAAAQAVSAGVPMGADRPRLLAVTILTSMDQKTMKEVGIGGAPKLRVVPPWNPNQKIRPGKPLRRKRFALAPISSWLAGPFLPRPIRAPPRKRSLKKLLPRSSDRSLTPASFLQ